ncbi:unnamed protein product [Paramecium pentaurelia]|uniref:Uncharacterized protein n=1 Tax=Paramecium pentaurelia TaxID=43138 RepID=A0A8S1VQK9_9CILI|nr:unnamed protein product [Paramecium pentaurelia]
MPAVMYSLLQYKHIVHQFMNYFAKSIQCHLKSYILFLLKNNFEGIARKKLPLILNAISWFTMISETLITKFFHQHGLSLLAIIDQSIILDLIWVGKFLQVLSCQFIQRYLSRKALSQNQGYLNLIGQVLKIILHIQYLNFVDNQLKQQDISQLDLIARYSKMNYN